MKKLIAIGMTMAFLSGLTASAITVNVSIVSGYQAGSGGEFNVTPVIGAGYAPTVLVNGGFETFCMDRNSGLAVPGTYNATVNTTGIDQAVPSQSLLTGVAWLFQQFALGTLAGYDYINTSGGTSSGRATTALHLQEAIWNLEGTYTLPGGSAGDLAGVNSFVALAITHFGGLAGATAFTTGNAYDVGILNLNNIATGAVVQPVLTLLPDGGSTLLLLGLGLSGLVLISRKVVRA